MEQQIKSRLTQQIAAAVEARLGRRDPAIRGIISQELDTALARRKSESSAHDLAEAARSKPEPVIERVVISAHGRNRTGIVARLSASIDEFHGDIRDISQTIVGDHFTMLVVVDIASARREGTHFGQLRERLQRVGEELGIHVVALHDDILSTMHRV